VARLLSICRTVACRRALYKRRGEWVRPADAPPRQRAPRTSSSRRSGADATRAVCRGPRAQFLPAVRRGGRYRCDALLIESCFHERSAGWSSRQYFVPDTALETAMRLAAHAALESTLVVPSVSKPCWRTLRGNRDLRALGTGRSQHSFVSIHETCEGPWCSDGSLAISGCQSRFAQPDYKI